MWNQFNEDGTLKQSVIDNFGKHEVYKKEMLLSLRKNTKDKISPIQLKIGSLNNELLELYKILNNCT